MDVWLQFLKSKYATECFTNLLWIYVSIAFLWFFVVPEIVKIIRRKP